LVVGLPYSISEHVKQKVFSAEQKLHIYLKKHTVNHCEGNTTIEGDGETSGVKRHSNRRKENAT
jgi:hypothetical protein